MSGTAPAARTTLAAVNKALAERGYTARLAKASGYFYFQFGEAAEWLDRTVQVERISDLTVQQWLAAFKRLRELNEKLAGGRKERRRRG